MYWRHRGCHNDGDGIITFIAVVLMVCFLLPIVGVYQLIAGNTSEKKVLGAVLTVVGIIIWIVIGA